jgi:hypothetical protein
MRILEFDKGDFEVLEEIEWDESVQRTSNLRFFPLEQQLDDLVQSILPVGQDIPPSLLRKANEARDLAKSLYKETTGYTDLGVPYAKTPIVDPLEIGPIPSWIIPKIGGVEILRDQPIESSELFKVINSIPNDEKKLPIWEANLYQQYEKQKILFGAVTTNSTNQTPSVAIYDGFRVTNKGSEKVPNYVAEPVTKDSRMLSSYKFGRGFQQANGDIMLTPEAIYPSESMDINGWVILPEESRNVLDKIKKETIVNPPTTQIWFQDKPVVLTEFRDIMNNRPTLEEVIEHFPKTYKSPVDKDLKKFLKKYNLGIKDIPWKKFEQLFPGSDEPEPYSGKVDKFEIELRTIPDSASLPQVYPPYQPGLTILNWINNQPDGGGWIRVAHMINSIKSKRETSIEISPIVAQPTLEKTTIGACMNADSYSAMLRTGVFDSASSTCVPVEILKRAEVQRRIKDRITHLELLKNLESYKNEIEILLLMSKASDEMLRREYEKFIVKGKEYEMSSERATILKILLDEEKPDSEKVQNIMSFIDEWKATVENYQFFKEGLFLICQHSIEQLQTKEVEEFYEKYAVVDSGRRLCKYCGEVIGLSNWDTTEEYDENGFKSITRDSMDGASVKLQSESQKKTTLLKNKLQVDVRFEGQMIFKLMMLLGIEPDEIQFDQFIRTAFSFTDMKMKGVPIMQQATIRELFGLAWFIILLKIHEPVLRPTRQFPRLIFSLEGYPRSTNDDNFTSPMLDYLMGVLIYAYRQSSSINVRKSRNALIGNMIDNPDRVRMSVMSILKPIVQSLGEVKFNNIEVGVGNAATISLVGVDNIEETTPNSLGQWLYGRILKNPSMPVLKGNQDLVDLIKNDYVSIEKKVAELRKKYLEGVVQSIPLIVIVNKSSDGSVMDQNVVLIEEKEEVIKRVKVENSELRAIVKSGTESLIESKVRELIKKNPTKDKTTISLKRNDTKMKVVYECKIVEGIARNLVRMFVGKTVNGYSSRSILSSDNDKVRASIRNIEGIVGKIPLLKYNGSWVKDIVESMNEFPSWAIVELRYMFFEWCLRTIVDDLKNTFGSNLVGDAVGLLVDVESEIYRYSPGDILDRIVKIRSKEREAFRVRLGQKSDAERNTIVDMMSIGLLESSVVVNMDDREAFADEVEAENYSVLPLSQSQDNDEEIPMEFYENGNYGELMDSPAEDYSDYNLSKYSDE